MKIVENNIITKVIYFHVVGNILDTQIPCKAIYDLKGSTYGRQRRKSILETMFNFSLLI